MTIDTNLSSDTQLVDHCLAGDRQAFGGIVRRYQRLICALAYSACGDVARSEDLAQETFLAGWRNLGSLKDRSRLKQWLCGIARHVIQDSRRRAARDPVALSAAREFAEGGVAVARHVNDSVASGFFQSSLFFRSGMKVVEHAVWLNLLNLLPVGLWWWGRGKQRRAKGV